MPSSVWEHFIKLDKVSAKCRYCNQILKHCSSTTSLTKHLEAKHVTVELKERVTGSVQFELLFIVIN